MQVVTLKYIIICKIFQRFVDLENLHDVSFTRPRFVEYFQSMYTESWFVVFRIRKNTIKQKFTECSSLNRVLIQLKSVNNVNISSLCTSMDQFHSNILLPRGSFTCKIHGLLDGEYVHKAKLCCSIRVSAQEYKIAVHKQISKEILIGFLV